MKYRATLKRLRLLFAGMALVLLASIVAAFFAGQSALFARQRVIFHDRVLERLQETFSVLLNAETGQRGYLLTGDEAYLEPYETAREKIEQQLSGLEEFAKKGIYRQIVCWSSKMRPNGSFWNFNLPYGFSKVGRGTMPRRR